MAEVNITLYKKNGAGTDELNPKSIASQVKMLAADGVTPSNVNAEIEALRALSPAAGAMVFKGVVDGTTALPTTNYKAGWTYAVGADGTYAGKVCEVGDSIICVKDYASGTASDNDWNVLQGNLTATYKTVNVKASGGGSSATDVEVTAPNNGATLNIEVAAANRSATLGDDLTLTGDATNKKITLGMTRDACTVSALADVPSTLRDGGLILLVTPTP